MDNKLCIIQLRKVAFGNRISFLERKNSFMMKRILSVLTCIVMVAAMVPAIALVPQRVEAAPYVMPSHNGLTNNTSYTLGAGTDAECTVKVDFRNSLSTKAFNLKYIIVHNTGTYVSTANAKNVHTNTNKTSTSAAWHYTVDNKEIYQGVPDKTFAGHAGTSRSWTPSSSNAIGIEMCVNNFPATETFGGELWNEGDRIMAWYENQFNQTMKNTAYLVAVLCQRWGLNYKTAVKMHYDALQYDPATNYGKDCPMQMRATYDEATNTFKKAGYYTTGRDGYFWQIFWSYLEQYAAGATSVTSPFDNKHTISFETNGGSAVDPVKVKDGETLSAPAAPTRYAFSFAGWYCNPELTDPYDFSTPVPYDFTLYAKWDEAYWEAQVNLMPNSQQMQLNNFNDQGEIWPYWNDDAFGSVTLYNGVTNADNWSWPSAFMEYENSFDSVNDTYLYVRKDGTAQFNVVMNYLDKDGVEHELYLSDVANLTDTTDFPAGSLEEYYNVGSYIRNLGHTPASGNVKFTKVTYYCIGVKDSYVKLYDLKLTSQQVFTDPYRNLMSNSIDQMSGYGNYNYDNGTLTMNATGAAGYSVKMNVNQEFDPSDLTNLLMDAIVTAPFNITMELTNGNGDATMEVKNEFFNVFGMEGGQSALPAGEWLVDMNLLGYYEWNGGVIDSSTIKSVTITLTAPGTLTMRGLQASRRETIAYVQDGLQSSGELTETPVEPDPPVDTQTGDVNEDGTITTQDARMAMLEALKEGSLTGNQLGLADYNGDGEITTTDARLMMLYALTH